MMRRWVEPRRVDLQHLRVDRHVGAARAHPSEDDPRRADQLRHLDDRRPGQRRARRQLQPFEDVEPLVAAHHLDAALGQRRGHADGHALAEPATRGSNFSSANGTTSVTAPGVCPPPVRRERVQHSAAAPTSGHRTGTSAHLVAGARGEVEGEPAGPGGRARQASIRACAGAPHSSRWRAIAAAKYVQVGHGHGSRSVQNTDPSTSTCRRPAPATLARARAGSNAARPAAGCATTRSGPAASSAAPWPAAAPVDRHPDATRQRRGRRAS